MRVDIGNALAGTVRGGISRESLERLDERVARVHRRVERGRGNGEFGYAALDLPARTDAGAIRAALEPVADAEAVLTVGIGGSALGAATVSAALGGPRVGDDGDGDDRADHYVLDNVDPAHAREVLAALPLGRTAVNVVSRSGTTTETLANFLLVRQAMERAGVDWAERTVVTTGEAGPLRDLADRHGLPTLPVPDGVPGRFAALSAVGLVPAAVQGYDVEAVLEGGRAASESLSGSLFDCPAYAYGAVAHALDVRGASINAVMPYAERLERFAEWFTQLWAESLGKDGLGQTPARALGATDQHSQLQLYRAGPRDKIVTLVRPRERPGRTVPETGIGELSYLGGRDLGAVLDAEFRATEASLAAADCPNVRVEVDRLDERGIGELLYGMEAACVLAGELYGVETFTQPAVEWGKRATRGLLGDGDTREATAATDKRELVVE